MKTKKELWVELEQKRGNVSLTDFFKTAVWKNAFRRLVTAPWRAETSSDPLDELRAKVERHLLTGESTAADALFAALSEDPELYVAGIREAGKPKASTPATVAKKVGTKASKKKALRRR